MNDEKGLRSMKYPKGIKKNTMGIQKKKNEVDYSSRGMTLEKDLDATNQYYLDSNIAVIHKKPTPVQIVNVDFPARNKAKIDEAYFKVPSTSDYNGIYKGKYIDFEAKETKNKTRFPFINIHAHQVDHMKMCQDHGGIVFLIIKFTTYNETFLYPFEKFYSHWSLFLEDGPKSIKYEVIKRDSYLIKEGFRPRLDYLKVVDTLIN